MQNEVRDHEHKDRVRFTKRTKRYGRHAITLAIGCAVGVFICVVKPFGGGFGTLALKADKMVTEENNLLSISTVEEILKPASDLVSMRYCYTDADVNENFKTFFGNKVPFTTDKVVFTYDGIVSVGIDLAAVKYEINQDKKEITLELPEMKVVSNEIDASSFKYPYKSDSIFNSTDMSTYTELIDVLKTKKEEDVKNNAEFMKSAQTNAKMVLKSFLTQAESTKDFTVNFKG